jgi:hypothetical protein
MRTSRTKIINRNDGAGVSTLRCRSYLSEGTTWPKMKGVTMDQARGFIRDFRGPGTLDTKERHNLQTGVEAFMKAALADQMKIPRLLSDLKIKLEMWGAKVSRKEIVNAFQAYISVNRIK